MQTYHGTMHGPAVFSEDMSFHGRLEGSATVARGVALRFHGRLSGDLDIEPEARVELRGRVNGSVFNRGRLVIYGQVRGSVRDEGGETTCMWPDAILSRT